MVKGTHYHLVQYLVRAASQKKAFLVAIAPRQIMANLRMCFYLRMSFAVWRRLRTIGAAPICDSIKAYTTNQRWSSAKRSVKVILKESIHFLFLTIGHEFLVIQNWSYIFNYLELYIHFLSFKVGHKFLVIEYMDINFSHFKSTHTKSSFKTRTKIIGRLKTGH